MKKRYESRYFIYDIPYKNSLKMRLFKLRNMCKGLWYDFALDFKKPRIEEKRYNVSICAIFKNEAPYLDEWLSFHMLVGVEHFYLYNNNSEDDYESVIKKYVDAGVVTVINWVQNHKQMEAYLDCVERFRHESKWIGFIDIDEFVIPKKRNNIYQILKDFENRGAVKMYWRLYGSSGRMSRESPGLVTEDFTVCWPKYCDIGKCFYNTAFEMYTDKGKGAAFHHDCWTRYKRLVMPPVNIYGNYCFKYADRVKDNDFAIQINHYFTKSYEEYGIKKSRGDVYFKINPHDEEYFFFHEMKCTYVDCSAYRYLIKLKKMLSDNIL